MTLRVLDLFSGIGGFSLGLERTGGFETVAFCEIEPFPRKVLAKHWPDVPCFEDVTKLGGHEIGPVDIITGGFPCQDISIAGKQKGMSDETRSGLWSEYHRLIGVLRPKYAIIENVTNLLAGPDRTGRWFARVLSDLAAIGYDAEWQCIPASSVGAWHKRQRVWIVAYSDKKRRKGCAPKQIFQKPTLSRKLVREFKKWPGRSNLPASRFCNCDDGIPERVVKLEALGNAIVPQIAELIGHAILEAENDT